MTPTPEDILQAVFDADEQGLRVVVADRGPVVRPAPELPVPSAAPVEATLSDVIAALAPGTPEQHVGTAASSAQMVTFSGASKHVTVSNPTEGGVLEVSLDGGASFVAVTGPGIISVPCRISSMQVRSPAGALPYGVIVTT